MRTARSENAPYLFALDKKIALGKVVFVRMGALNIFDEI
jgi:hypothetical protein